MRGAGVISFTSNQSRVFDVVGSQLACRFLSRSRWGKSREVALFKHR